MDHRDATQSLRPSATRRVRGVSCTVCGCVCDDLEVDIRDDEIVGYTPECWLADRMFRRSTVQNESHARIQNRSVSVNDAIYRATDILSNSRSPLIYGLARSSTPGQRAAVLLADRIGAIVDTAASTCHAPSILALQSAGESTCSLGEIRSRADLIVYWGSNPVHSHPRHIERFVNSGGEFVPRGRADRRLVVVDIERTETARVADTFFQVNPGGDFDVIWNLRGRLAGVALSQGAGGLSSDQLDEFAELLRASRYGAMFFGLGLTRGSIPHLAVEALLRLVIDLNHNRRFVARRMRIPGDVAGADSVLCWQTGFPFSINLGRGFPRYNPGEFSGPDVLRREEADAAVIIGSDCLEQLSADALAHLQRIPTVVLDPPGACCLIRPEVAFTTAIYGLHRPGTAYRMDEIPIPLRAVVSSPYPADHEILERLVQGLELGQAQRTE